MSKICEIVIRNIDGEETDMPRPRLNIKSHYPWVNLVDLSFGDGPTITVNGHQLIEAVNKAMKVGD